MGSSCVPGEFHCVFYYLLFDAVNDNDIGWDIRGRISFEGVRMTGMACRIALPRGKRDISLIRAVCRAGMPVRGRTARCAVGAAPHREPVFEV